MREGVPLLKLQKISAVSMRFKFRFKSYIPSLSQSENLAFMSPSFQSLFFLYGLFIFFVMFSA